MTKSGFEFLIFLAVSSSENKLVSFLDDEITPETKLEVDSTLVKFEPTNPLAPKIKILIFYPFLLL